MTEARVTAQAKINLRLKVLAREDTGFHQIETVFHRVDLADNVVVRVNVATSSIDCRGAACGPSERNLAYRAAQAYAERAQWPRAWAIDIDKQIPVGGGMGGGSADAGAVLRAFDALNPSPLGAVQLRDLAVRLGADVPFMTTTDPMALAWGRGERMLGLPALSERAVVALVPDFGVSTADAYRWIDESRSVGTGPREAWRKAPAQLSDWAAIERFAENDFDDAVFPRFPQLGDAAAALRDSGAVIAMLSGSGSTVVGVFTGSGEASLSSPAGFRALWTRTALAVPAVEKS
jgi:4-diphosphocytidyl-2-C-methyl-D-erythritol kinase